jgi:hypothetical protein
VNLGSNPSVAAMTIEEAYVTIMTNRILRQPNRFERSGKYEKPLINSELCSLCGVRYGLHKFTTKGDYCTQGAIESALKDYRKILYPAHSGVG